MLYVFNKTCFSKPKDAANEDPKISDIYDIQ